MAIKAAHYRRIRASRGRSAKIGSKRTTRKTLPFSTRLSGFPGADVTERAWRGSLHRRFEYFRDIGRK